ncbi:MAG: beta-lactamase domain protein [Ramlibacter sp.]|jgi:metallo-beta-lactamase family protein|nr:beta-lactamase domain protein [Ramlibacter sp.]MCE3273975.1 beta-lactamase domain protein [Ramlibacter sp.]
MQLQFLGATGTVTGSKYLVSAGEASVMVDCGLFQGYKQLRLRNWDRLPVDPRTIDAVVLTHAHIDHSGYVPLLVKNGFRGRIHCSEATYELCRILLPDSGRLQEEEASYANRAGYSRHHPALPLYTGEDAERCLKQFEVHDFGSKWSPAAGLNATMAHSGHMLGSSFVRLDDGRRSLLFSGDIGRPDDPVLYAPARMDGADYLVVESTYGNRRHEPTNALVKLAEVINRTAARGGVVVIPAFAVGRAQSLLYAIHLLKKQGLIHHLPVYLNSPMAADATEIYHRFHEEHRLTREECEAMCREATIVNSPDESRALNARKGPMVIIAASGMATGGRVVYHLKAFAPDRRNTILFAGYQAGGTRGARILAGEPTVRIQGEEVPVRAEVASLDNLSAHADFAEIVDWLRGFARPPKQTFITHGEPDAADAMRQHIERELGWACRVPDYLETVKLQ